MFPPYATNLHDTDRCVVSDTEVAVIEQFATLGASHERYRDVVSGGRRHVHKGVGWVRQDIGLCIVSGEGR